MSGIGARSHDAPSVSPDDTPSAAIRYVDRPRDRRWDLRLATARSTSVTSQISAGTSLPPGLAIVRDAFNDNFGATHYTIAPAFDMPLEQFKRLLLELAKNAVKEAA